MGEEERRRGGDGEDKRMGWEKGEGREKGGMEGLMMLRAVQSVFIEQKGRGKV